MGDSSSTIRVMCPNLRCRAVLGVPDAARGRLVRCQNCGMNIKIPSKSEPRVAPAEAPDAKKAG
jgi:hypothetical protein